VSQDEIPHPRVTYDYAGLKRLATYLSRPVSTLVALAAVNDPFYISPARQTLADWFADEIWPLVEAADEHEDPLFDSTRGYVEQMDRYKEHQGKPTRRKPRAA
jgi:hypothetical protein